MRGAAVSALTDIVSDVSKLAACKLWPGCMMQLKHDVQLLTYADLQDYRNKLLRFWNDPECAPTKGEKQLFNACYATLVAAGFE